MRVKNDTKVKIECGIELGIKRITGIGMRSSTENKTENGTASENASERKEGHGQKLFVLQDKNKSDLAKHAPLLRYLSRLCDELSNIRKRERLEAFHNAVLLDIFDEPEQP
ncbi:hypothetical protein EVAR_99793_1 [Eumeta japonica]|uniref:Uncharacterized protein n=1 Tax=Eumeta variegata TaxID=151549 RepID=A0A4C1ZA53_EUMVA|nr:hypothetical protein EVAR_99793_1 [Eumeta japonica]